MTCRILVACCFVAFAIFLLCFVFIRFPRLERDERQSLRLPRSIEDVKLIGIVLNKYKDRHYSAVLGAVLLVYVLLQSFAIPGSIFLTVLSGFLFPFWTALTLVCSCSAIGASVCYFLSSLFGRRFVLKLFPDKFAQWSKMVSQNADHMLFYMIFLRITPIFPNWSVNLAAPFLQVPFGAFFLGTFIGVAPPSLLFIEAGKSLNDLVALENPFSVKRMLFLSVLALLSLMPVYGRRHLENLKIQKALFSKLKPIIRCICKRVYLHPINYTSMFDFSKDASKAAKSKCNRKERNC